ncbi:MAG TPA: histidine kinase dimerization/phospho-acceptor domain-containing protein [Candidatus Deferrimicrobium sp.]|nr:histidine kinase dimerization/phospho-acceptor domain-containing protein [Candidatus Deferrimicrobium sp.]
MANSQADKFEIIRQLALAASGGVNLSQASHRALQQAADYVGLQAAALFLWDEEFKVTVTVNYAASEAVRQRLLTLEEELFVSLRKTRNLVSAYLSFGGDTPLHSFTLPLRHGQRVFGAVVGVQEGQRTTIAEDDFLEALSALLALNYVAEGIASGKSIPRELLSKERLSAIIETAVAVNHEVNNPLTAILGNVQLLLLKRRDLDADLTAKLKTIETSALKIKDVTQRLMRITAPKSVEYSEGTKMLDLSSDENESK